MHREQTPNTALNQSA